MTKLRNATKFKKILEEEKARLIGELGEVGEVNPDNPRDWLPTPPPDIQREADPVDAADEIEEYNERVGIEVPLEERLVQVEAALKAINEDTYGICNVGGEAHPIEEKRLEANPAALTCVAHMK